MVFNETLQMKVIAEGKTCGYHDRQKKKMIYFMARN